MGGGREERSEVILGGEGEEGGEEEWGVGKRGSVWSLGGGEC